jgi:hypothetical protein
VSHLELIACFIEVSVVGPLMLLNHDIKGYGIVHLQLVEKVHALLAEHSKTLHGQSGEDLPQKENSSQKEKGENFTFYSPAWSHVQG